MMSDSSGDHDSDSLTVKWPYLAGVGGGVALLLLVLFCVVFTLLCIVLARLRKLFRRLDELLPHAVETATAEEKIDLEPDAVEKKQLHSEEHSPETKLSNTENSTSAPDPKVEATYAVVSEEHKLRKKMAKLNVQQYDDINLLPLNGNEAAGAVAGEKGEGDESKVVVSVQMERSGDMEGYSRLCHAGPRMGQPKRYLYSSLSTSSPQLLEEGSDSKDDRTGSVKDEKPYSDVDHFRPRSRLIGTGGYSMIEQSRPESDVPPPLPGRMKEGLVSSSPVKSGLLKTARSASEIDLPVDKMSSAAPAPYQNLPPAEPGVVAEPPRGGAGYSLIANPVSPPKVPDNFFEFSDVIEFRNLQAQEQMQDQLYEKVK